MQDSGILERMKSFEEYLDSEISVRKNAGTHKMMRSRTDFVAIMQLYRCGLKNEASFEGLKKSGDIDTAQAVKHVLDALDIYSFGFLSRWSSSVKQYADGLISLQKEGREKITKDDFTSLLRLKTKKRPYVVAALTLFTEGCGDDFTPRAKLREYLEIMNPEHTSQLCSMLLLTLAPKRRDNDGTASQPASDSGHEVPSPGTSGLIDQIDTLKAELESAYIRLNSSEENCRMLQEEGHESAMNEVLRLMNSPASGKLIDQFAKAEKTLKQLQSEKKEIPGDLTVLSVCVKIFMRTMRNVFGVEPVMTPGEILEINLDQAVTRYSYSGSEFEGGEFKKVEVTAPGWKRGDEIFSLPEVIELHE